MKINSIHFGGKMISAALLIGIVLPGIIWCIKGIWYWQLLFAGIAILTLFFVIFAIEMKQDNGKNPYYIRHLREKIPYDEEKQYPVIKASICTGEMVAGFKEKNSNGFTEVMVIHSEKEKELFMKIYDLETVKIEY